MYYMWLFDRVNCRPLKGVTCISECNERVDYQYLYPTISAKADQIFPNAIFQNVFKSLWITSLDLAKQGRFLCEECAEEIVSTEIDESIKIKILVQRANGISATIDWIDEEPRPYKCFKYGNTTDNIFLLENSLSISHGDYLNIYIDPRKLDKPINPRRTKFSLECDIWSRRTMWDYRDKKDTTDHFISSDEVDITEFRNKKCSYPRFFDNYRDYRVFIEDTWKSERIIITEKDVATFQNLDNKEIIKVWLGGAGKEKCFCGAIENDVITILCPEDKIMSFRSKRDFESYHHGEEIYDSHRFNVYLES